MTKTPKIPPDITEAIERYTWKYHELETRKARVQDAIAGFRQRYAAARAANDIKRAGELANKITALHSALDGINRDMGQVRQAHAQQLQAAELARQPADKLTVKCPDCGTESDPVRAWGSGQGYRSGEYDCPACDAGFSARWSGGIDPEVSIR